MKKLNALILPVLLTGCLSNPVISVEEREAEQSDSRQPKSINIYKVAEPCYWIIVVGYEGTAKVLKIAIPKELTCKSAGAPVRVQL